MVKEFLKKHRLLVLFITLLCIPLIITFSRYIAKVITDYYLEAKNFYFNSDKLKSDHPTYQINNWNGIDKVDFVINLDSKKNELKVADMDIDYDIEFTCESDVICSTNKTNGVINNETNVDSFTLSVTPKRTFNKDESTTVKGGILEGEVIDAAKVQALSELPSKEILLAQVASCFQAPIQRLCYVFEEIRKKKEEEATA